MPAGDGCLLLALLPAAQSPVPRRPEPFVRVGVSYRSELSRDRERAAADLEAIKTLGFNSHARPVEWAGGRASPRRNTNSRRWTGRWSSPAERA